MPKFNTLSGFTRTFLLFCSFVCLSCANTGEGGPVFRRGLNRARWQHTHSRLWGKAQRVVFLRGAWKRFASLHIRLHHPDLYHSTAFTLLLGSSSNASFLRFSYFYTSSYGFPSIFPSNLFFASAKNKKRRRKFAPERTRRKQQANFRAAMVMGGREKFYDDLALRELLKKVSHFLGKVLLSLGFYLFKHFHQNGTDCA